MAATTSSSECFLFRIPLEIRLEIYRYLLLPVPARQMGLDFDDPDSNPIGMIAKIRDLAPHQRKLLGLDNEDSDDDSLFDGERIVTHTSILRVSRQISEEAISLFYSELIIMIEPGDIVCCSPWKADIVPPNRNVWRSNPLKNGLRSSARTGGYQGVTMGGRMEPHVFSRFQKINLVLDFDWTLDDVELNLDAECNVHSADVATFTEGLQKSTFLETFVKILSSSREIKHLSVSLSIDIMAYFDDEDSDNDDEDTSDSDLDSDSDSSLDSWETESESDIEAGEAGHGNDPSEMETSSDSEHGLTVSLTLGAEDSDDTATPEPEDTESPEWVEKNKELLRDDKANERAVEIFLDSGILDPLGKLTNVESFNLNFDIMDALRVYNKYKPLSKHVKMIRDLKNIIEENFVRERTTVVMEDILPRKKKATRSAA